MPRPLPIGKIKGRDANAQPRVALGPNPTLSHEAKMIHRFLSDDAGQGLVEYALIIALVSIVAIAALSTLGWKADNALDNAANQLS